MVPFLAAFAQTSKQPLASSAASALRGGVGLLQGDPAPAQAFVDAQQMIFNMQTSPLPTALTIRQDALRAMLCCCLLCADVSLRSFDIFIRAQVQVNGGDIATVL